jgi:hypothetical protein
MDDEVVAKAAKTRRPRRKRDEVALAALAKLRRPEPPEFKLEWTVAPIPVKFARAPHPFEERVLAVIEVGQACDVNLTISSAKARAYAYRKRTSMEKRFIFRTPAEGITRIWRVA